LAAIPAFLRAFLEQSTLSNQPQTPALGLAPRHQTHPLPAWSSNPPMQFPPHSQYANQQQPPHPHFATTEHRVSSAAQLPPPSLPPSSDFHLLPSALLDESALSALAPAFQPTVHPSLTGLAAPPAHMPASHSAHNLAAMLPAVAEPSMFASQQFQYSQAQSVSALSSESPETISGSSSAPSAFHPTSVFGAGAMHFGAINGTSTSLGDSLHGLSAGDPASFTGSALPVHANANANTNANANANANANIADLLMRVVGALERACAANATLGEVDAEWLGQMYWYVCVCQCP
jgi:hypothetical protein